MRKSEKVKKYLLILFLGIVSVGMVLTLAGLPSGGIAQTDINTLAQIGGKNITTQQLRQALDARLRNSQYGYNPSVAAAMAQPYLDDMIQNQALILQAQKIGIVASQEEVLHAAQSIPGLYKDGVFIGRDQLEQAMGMSLEQFEGELRDSIVAQKMQSIVTNGIQVGSDEVRAEFIKRNNKVKIEYVLFDPSQFIKDVKATPEAVAAFFKNDPSHYNLPERRRVRYVLIDSDRVRAAAKVTEDDVKQYYDQHLSDFRVPDRVRVAHILFKTTGKTPAEGALIEKKANDVLAQVKAGKDFGDLAKQFSDDSSAQKGGEIGWIVRGQTVKEFEDAAFSMKPGDVSDIIKTIYGFHIIKLEDKQTAHLQTLDEVKDQIRADLSKQKMAQVQQSMSDELDHKFRSDPTNFESIAKSAGLDVQETAPFKYKETVPDFGNSEAIANLAFQLHVNEVGEPISVPKGTAIIQVTQISPAHQATLEEVRAQVEEDYRAAQSKALATEKARQLADKSKTQDFKASARLLGLTVKESKDFAQQDFVEGVGSGTALAAAFTLAPGQTSDVTPVGGNQVVFRVESRTQADLSALPQQQDQIASELVEQKRSLAFEIYKKNLKLQLIQSGKLKINDDAMKQFVQSYQQQS